MNVGISQSNYIPWLGFFEFISRCDKFVILDTVQFTKNDWRNRNKIVIQGKIQWLTIPVMTNNSLRLKVNQVQVADLAWSNRHLKTLTMAYGKYRFFREFKKPLENLYLSVSKIRNLSEINIRILDFFCKQLEIKTELVVHTKTDNLEKNDRIIEILLSLESNQYTFTPKALNYLDKDSFQERGIELKKCDFSLTQSLLSKSGNPFSDKCSIIDSIARHGIVEIRKLLKST